VTEITRRYYACAVALAKAMGLPLSETFLREHRESISCCFIEAGRAGVRLPAAVHLPPLAADSPVAQDNGDAKAAEPEPESIVNASNTFSPPVAGPPTEPEPAVATNGDTPALTIVPAEAALPCGGQTISTLKPAQLAMLISKTARLVRDDGERWAPLLHALQSERQARLERGRKVPAPEGAADGA